MAGDSLCLMRLFVSIVGIVFVYASRSIVKDCNDGKIIIYLLYGGYGPP